MQFKFQRAASNTNNKAIVDSRLCCCMQFAPLCTTTKSNSVASPGEYVGNTLEYVMRKHDIIHKTGST